MDNENVVIEVKNVSKFYKYNHGVFDISFSINEGDAVGFIGSNGAGKTTTLRMLMGFIKPDKGSLLIKGLDCWTNSKKIKKFVGYVPGEISFPDVGSGFNFINFQKHFKHVKKMDIANDVIKDLQLDLSAGLSKMSKGMKQKTAIVNALMSDPEILILDEPTTGLDPLMRLSFIDLLLKEKEKKKTILITSPLYEEIEKVCDKVILIDKGNIICVLNIDKIKKDRKMQYVINFKGKNDFNKFIDNYYEIEKIDRDNFSVLCNVNKQYLDEFLDVVSNCNIESMYDVKFSLNDLLLEHLDSYYKNKEKGDNDVNK